MSIAEAMAATQDEAGRVLRRLGRRELTEAQREAVGEWAAYLRINRGLSAATCANYFEAIGVFFEWANQRADAGAADMQAIGQPQITRWQQELYVEHGQSASARHVKLVGVRQFYAWGMMARGWALNPAAAVPSPKRPKLVPVKFSRTQLQALFRTFDTDTRDGRRDFAALLLFLATGARRGEITNLRMEQIELRKRTGAVKFTGKGAKERIVPFEGPAVDALRRWFTDLDTIENRDLSAVFVSFVGRKAGQALGPRGLDSILRRALKRARLRVPVNKALHLLRSTFATALYDQTKDIERVRVAMGHDNINTTRGYIAISETQLRTRLSSSYLEEVTGMKDENLPAWVRLKLGEG